MIRARSSLNRLFASLAVIYATSLGAATAQPLSVEDMLEALPTVPPAEAQRLAGEIAERWSASGSPSMDLLLQRGKDAIEAEEFERAITVLTALTDHAPDFAEGWHARSLAFFSAGRYGESLADLQTALVLNPDRFMSYIGVALILRELGYIDEALIAAQAAEAIHPHEESLAELIDSLRRETGGQTL